MVYCYPMQEARYLFNFITVVFIVTFDTLHVELPFSGIHTVYIRLRV